MQKCKLGKVSALPWAITFYNGSLNNNVSLKNIINELIKIRKKQLLFAHLIKCKSMNSTEKIKFTFKQV